MKRAVIIAAVAMGSSLVLYAGIGHQAASQQKTQTECCDQSECCPMGSKEDCCEYGCE